MPRQETFSGCTVCCGGGIETDCCPGDPIPQTLTATLASPDCPLLDGETITITNSGGQLWSGDSTIADCTRIVITAECNGGNWMLALTGDAPPGFQSSGTPTASCSPFQLDITFPAMDPVPGSPCCDTSPAEVSITVTP